MDGIALAWLKCWGGRATICFTAPCICYISELKKKGFSQVSYSEIKIRGRTMSRPLFLRPGSMNNEDQGWVMDDGKEMKRSQRELSEL